MIELALLLGFLAFPDDGTVREGMAGVAAQHSVSPRVAIGPEFIYVRGRAHSHTMLTGNVTFVLASRRVTPYAIVGGGYFQTRERFSGEVYTSYDPAFTAGGGVRIGMTDRITAGVDVRVGWELHVRTAGVVAVQLR